MRLWRRLLWRAGLWLGYIQEWRSGKSKAGQNIHVLTSYFIFIKGVRTPSSFGGCRSDLYFDGLIFALCEAVGQARCLCLPVNCSSNQLAFRAFLGITLFAFVLSFAVNEPKEA